MTNQLTCCPSIFFYAVVVFDFQQHSMDLGTESDDCLISTYLFIQPFVCFATSTVLRFIPRGGRDLDFLLTTLKCGCVGVFYKGFILYK